ncbi:hypothetical protein ELQ12_09585, partial [Campylobacter sp. US25a]
EDENTIYFCDVYKNVKNKEIEYNPNINNILNQACISSIYKEQSLRTNSFTHSSINANTPLNLLSLHSNKVPYEQELNNKAYYNEHFYESEYSFTKSIDLKTKPSLKEKRVLVLNESLLAKSNIYHLSLGDFITLNYKEFNHQEEIKNQDEEKQDKASLLKDFIIIANTQILIDDAILANSINTNDHLNLKDLNLSKSYSNTLTLLKKNIIFTPSFKAKKNCSFTADNVNTMANQESVLTAQKQIVSRVGNTTITQTKDKIILQVGTTQVIIDSKGLRVKGGDLRAD